MTFSVRQGAIAGASGTTDGGAFCITLPPLALSSSGSRVFLSPQRAPLVIGGILQIPADMLAYKALPFIHEN
jgi:hypothetical protein